MPSLYRIERGRGREAATVSTVPLRLSMNLPSQMDWRRFSLAPSQGEQGGGEGSFSVGRSGVQCANLSGNSLPSGECRVRGPSSIFLPISAFLLPSPFIIPHLFPCL